MIWLRVKVEPERDLQVSQWLDLDTNGQCIELGIRDILGDNESKKDEKFECGWEVKG